MQGAVAQFNVSGPGFLPDENGTNLDDPQAKKGTAKVAAGSVIKDCAECPEMVVIPAGSFVMGSDKSANEQPMHLVNVPSYLLGKTHITLGQWLWVMGESLNQLYAGRNPDLPFINVSWRDVQDFILKLNRKTGRKYRLPTEAEWEYAARAGTTTEWSHGNDEAMLGAYAWYALNSGNRWQKVAQKMPNPFELYDMQGNVWQWVEDCWHDDYKRAPSNGIAWITDCISLSYVVKGGSWYSSSSDLRPPNRSWGGVDTRTTSIGFRLARDLSLADASEVAAKAEQDKKNAEAARAQKEREEASRKERERQRKEQEDKIKKMVAKELEIKEQTEEVKKMRIAKNADVEITALDTSPTLAAKILDKYAASIQAAIRPNITFDPDSIAGNPAVDIQVALKADGLIVGIAIVKSSGVRSWDTAAFRALEKTEHLPKDDNGRVPPTLVITLRPRER